MASGTAWLASPQGLVTLVDGPSEQVIGTIRSGDTATPPAVVQTGTSALLVDGEAGTVTRVDGTTYAVRGPVSFGEGPLQVLSDDSRTVVVQGGRGVAEVVDSTSLEVLREVAVGATVGAGQAVLGGDGTLWLVDSAGGGLSAVDGSGEVSVTHPVGDGAARLVTAAGRPVLVDVSGGRLGAVDDSGDVSSWLCAGEELDANSRLLGAAASARVFAVSSATGRFVAADLAAGTCTGGVIAPPGADLGPLVEARGAVLVPDRTTGQVLVVDPATAGVVATPATVGPGTPFELIAKDGVVFWNDLAGPAAGVVSFRDGGWTVGTPLAKFSTGSTTVPSLAPATDSLP